MRDGELMAEWWAGLEGALIGCRLCGGLRVMGVKCYGDREC